MSSIEISSSTFALARVGVVSPLGAENSLSPELTGDPLLPRRIMLSATISVLYRFCPVVASSQLRV